MAEVKVSVFGGTGFIGSTFVGQLGPLAIVEERSSRKPERHDVAYFISTTDNYNVFDDVHKDVDVNLTILLDVLKNLQPGKSVFNFISSWFVYGETDLPATEESVCRPKGFYSITKRCAEELVISYCETFGIEYRILRLCNVYGPSDAGVSKKKNALQYLISCICQGEEISLYHNGNFYRDYMHVKDVARAIELVINKGKKNTVYNIGSGNKVLFKNLIDEVFSITGSSSNIKAVEPPEFHKVVQVKDFYMNVDRLKSLGFVPRVSLSEGLQELCQLEKK